MSNTLRTAAVVVGAIALAATGVGAAVSAGLIAATATTAVIATVATVATFAAGALTLAASATARPPGTTISGNQTQFRASMDQGLPWVIGHTATAGLPVHDITFDASGSSNNAFQTFFGVWSADRIVSVVKTTIDKNEVDFALDATDPTVPDEAIGTFHDWMWMRTQLGASPEAEALKATGFFPYPPGWSETAKLSGKAAFSWTLKFDTSGGKYPSGIVPQKLDELEGAPAYDPRLDSTYPGGSGAQRVDDEPTWAFTENPFLLGMKWARGIWQNGKKVMGIGLALAAIDTPSAVYAANVADANGWKVGGVVYSTDPKWDVLKKILLAGSGEPLRVGGKLYFMVDAPRVSLATIANEDIIGKATVPSGAAMRDRINGIIPTYRSPDHNWELVPAAKITVDDYVTFDRRPRTKALTYELVQDADQLGQLATYAICNSREIDGIVAPLKIRWIGYRPGDAVTFAASIVAMDDQLVVLRHRRIDPATGAITFTSRTETTAKHPFALGQTATPPPTPALATVDRTGLLQPGIDAASYGTANLIQYSRFEAGTTGWAKRYDPVPIESEALHVGTYLGKPFLDVKGAATAAGQIISLGTAEDSAFPVTPGARLAVSCGFQALGPCGNRKLAVFFRNAAGASVASDGGDDLAHTNSGAAYDTQIAGFVTVPAGAVKAVIECSATSNGAGTLDLAITDPIATIVSPTTSVPPTFVPGRNAHDGADVTAAVFAGLSNGRSPQTVLDDADLQALNVLAQATQLGNYKVATDVVLYDEHGNDIGFVVDAIKTTVAGHDVVYAKIIRTDDGLFRVITTINEDGVITGTENFVNGEKKSEYYVIADIFGVVQTVGGVPVKPFVIVDGIAYFDHIKVRQLDSNVAIVPARASQSARVYGDYADTDGDIPLAATKQTPLSIDITMPEPGTIEIDVVVSQQHDGNIPKSWAMALDVDGSILPESYAKGFNMQEAVPVKGIYTPPAGTSYPHTLTATLRHQGEVGVSITNRLIFGKGFRNAG